MTNTLGPSPGAARAPDHRIDIRPLERRLTVSVDGRCIADGDRALILDETGYDRVFYLPPQDVCRELLRDSDSRSSCPFKGEAKYYAFETSGGLRDIGWYYPQVYDEVAPIAGYIAFYPDRVAVSIEE